MDGWVDGGREEGREGGREGGRREGELEPYFTLFLQAQKSKSCSINTLTWDITNR